MSGQLLTLQIFSTTDRFVMTVSANFYLWLLCFIIVVHSSMKTSNFFGCFSFDKPQFGLFSFAKKRVFEYKHLVILFDFVKIIHIELNTMIHTCRTKEEKLECLKYLGRISLVKATTSITAKPISSLSQQMIFLFSGCWFKQRIPPGSRRSLGGMMQLYRYSFHCYCGAVFLAA